VGLQTRLLGDHCAVDVHDSVTGDSHRIGRAREQIKARCAFELWIAGGKELPDIAQAGGAEQRVDHGMREHVRVRVAVKTHRVRDPHASEDQIAAGLEWVDVIPDPDPHSY